MDLTLLALAKGYTDKQIEKAVMGDIQLDHTLTKEGAAADAKAVGQAIENIELTPGPKGDTGPQGPEGPQGTAGKTAYEYACEGGYDGSEDDFSKHLANTPLMVTVAENADGTFSADKTYQELREACEAGRTLICLLSDYYMVLPHIGDSSSLVFSAVDGNTSYRVSFQGFGVQTIVDFVRKELAQMSDISVTQPNLLVTVTNNGLLLSADKSCEDILKAHQAGSSVRCTFMVFTLPLVRATEEKCTFSGVYNAQIYTISITSDGTVTVTNEEIEGSLSGVKTVNGIAPDDTGNVDLNTFPTLKQTGTWRGDTDFTTLTEIRFVENYTPAGNADSWDASSADDGSIMAYREGDILTVSANGKRKIKLNANAAGMFIGSYKLKKILGLDMLDASDATNLGGMFVNCWELTDVDMSMWYCGKVTKAGGMFQYCYDLRSVKMPHGLNSDTVTVTASMFEDCFKLVEVDMANGPTFIGDRMFARCVNLERVTGLSAVTTIGTRAFVYCAKLKDIDLNPAILTSIGESAFRLSSVEDCINLDDLNTACVVGDYATRAKRWSDNAMLTAIRTKDIPTVFLSVPHADSQKKYTDVKFGYKDGPWDEDTDPDFVSIARGGCSALSLYHEWQCIHKGTELEKANFLDYWKDFEGDKFADINTDAMGDHFPVQAAMLGWGHSETLVTGVAQYDVIIDRLNKRLPTCIIMRSTNISGYHAVVVIGADALSRKLAVLDSAVTAEGAVLTWVKFEDIFTAAGTADKDYDRIVVHTFGEGFEGYEPPEYVPVPETASVGQTIVVKAVDENGKPTEWEAVDMAAGGEDVEGWELISDTTITAEDEVWKLVIDKKDDGNSFAYNELCLVTNTLAGSATSVARIFVNQESPYHNIYCATVNGYFVTNAQTGGVTYIKNMCSVGLNPWFQLITNRSDGVFIGRHRTDKADVYNTTLRSFGIQTSSETVYMSGRFTLYGR